MVYYRLSTLIYELISIEKHHDIMLNIIFIMLGFSIRIYYPQAYNMCYSIRVDTDNKMHYSHKMRKVAAFSCFQLTGNRKNTVTRFVTMYSILFSQYKLVVFNHWNLRNFVGLIKPVTDVYPINVSSVRIAQ